MNTIGLLISAYAPTVTAASITATFVLLPLGVAVASLSVKVTALGAGSLAFIGLLAIASAAALLARAGRSMQRGKLLTV